MNRRIEQCLEGGTRLAKRWLCLRAQECRVCRECDQPVSVMEVVCPRCGVRNPIKVSATVPIVLGVVGVTIFLVVQLVFRLT